MSKLAIGAIALIAVTLVTFQNCSKVEGAKSKTSSSESPTVQNSGNGDVYGGKVYIYVNPDGKCPDGSYVKSSIGGDRESGFFLIRDNCQALASKISIQSSEVVVIDADKISYNGHIYTLEGSGGTLAYGGVSISATLADAVTTFTIERAGVLTASSELTFIDNGVVAMRLTLEGPNGFVGCGNGASWPAAGGTPTINTSCVEAIPAGTYTLRNSIQGTPSSVVRHIIKYVVVPR